VTLHARVGETAAAHAIVRAIKARLKTRFGVDHATVEIEPADAPCADDGQAHHDACGPIRT
jgi:Co/Zn/Cd efflux system component